MDSNPDTFTIREMREAFAKHMRGEPLTEKERLLAEAMAAAVRSQFSGNGSS